MFPLSTPTTTIALLALLLTPAHSWVVGLYSTQNSCGGDWAPDTSRGGVAHETSSCQGFGFTEIKAMNISDWDDGCKVVAYDSWQCENALDEWIKEEEKVVDGNWSCINNLMVGGNLANFEAFRYICE
ncbi:hypothetical protein GQ43DRAFT_471349 [Delitschia confertaspora ATCC 74209]|uniref:Uncharacterized protein n=1 Tax=Delitschia confertaspora ATCC 74209 TaxID=1513339 RepID=A0A9P4JSS6_9PLEO|nr:hypothetical protein GQ43DRAFT_471349 [Delitschia confertaspora ATCC 74209]